MVTILGPITVPFTVITFLLLTIAIYYLFCFKGEDSAYYNIPGPKGHFFSGNSNQLGNKPWEQLQKWALQYGEIFHLRLGANHFVYVNSREAVRELFDKQSATTSCKGPVTGASEIVHGLRLALMPYGSRWRKSRAIVHRLLTQKRALTYTSSQEFEATQLIYDLLENQNVEQTAFYTHVERYTTSGKLS